MKKSNTSFKMSDPVRVAITGAAGQIAYSLIPLISKGDVFGVNQPVILHLLDIPPMMDVLRGVVMEIEDGAFPLVKDVIATDDVEKAFEGIDVAFLLGSMPRKQGMERRDLLAANVKIFKAQGEALDKFAKKTVKVLVVGNPANTNALICLKYAPSIPKENFSALTRLDQNRARSNIAKQLGVSLDKVQNVIIWGNHSCTQVPDVKHASVEINGKVIPVTEALKRTNFSVDDFIKEIQNRGGAVIAARKMSSAMSAAKASADHVHDIWHGTAHKGQHVSMGVYSDGTYGIPKDIVFSFPVKLQAKQFKIVEDLPLDDHTRSKLDITTNELLEERQEALLVCNF